MNYRHAYHAGNAADVFKHCVLVQLLGYLLQKPQPFCYLETHAGSPLYDLSQSEAAATQEFADGIAKIWDKTHLPLEINHYLQIQKNINSDKLHYYLGSAGISQTLLRANDRAILCDISSPVCQQLRRYFKQDTRFHIHHQNGFHSLKALLPPKEKRGLVFIDPPYEALSDWDDIISALQTGYQKWPTGIYAVWYPIKDKRLVQQLEKKLLATCIPAFLKVELCPWPKDVPHRLNGSGLFIVNPPWKLEATLKTYLPILCQYLSKHTNAYASVECKT